MKTFAGILGILGGLLGMAAFSFNFVQGLVTRPVDDNVTLGVVGGLASFICIAASVAVFTGAGRWAGAGLLAAALVALAIALSYGGAYLVAFSVVGGVLAVLPRHGRLRPDEREHLEWETERRLDAGR